jgi:hypothetical protein
MPAYFQTDYFCLIYSILALTTDAICIMSIVWPSFNVVKSVTFPVLPVVLVLLNIFINLASATILFPAFYGLPLTVFVRGSEVAPKNAAKSAFNFTGLFNPFSSAMFMPPFFSLIRHCGESIRTLGPICQGNIDRRKICVPNFAVLT